MALPLPTEKLWAIEPTSLLNIIQAAQAANGRLRGVNGAPGRIRGETAIIDIMGPLTKEATFLTELFGIASTSQIRRAVNAAAAADSVKEIILRIDSPGGTVAGTDDLAMDVRAAAERKPVTAYVEDLGASAAYWIASQATHIYVNRTGAVGSIGAFLVVYDFSRMLESVGIETHLIRSGKFKGIGVMGSKIDTEALEHLQGRIDKLASLFIDAISRGRRMTAKLARQLATGEVWIGQEAVDVGLVNGIRTFDEASLAAIDAAQTATRAVSKAPRTVSKYDNDDRATIISRNLRPQLQAVASTPRPTTPTPPRDHIAEWNQAVELRQQNGLTRLDAIRAVDRDMPGMRHKMLAAQRSQRR